MRANTNVQLKDRLQLKLEDFKGVDFSTSPLRVQSNRAATMSNFINEYGVNRKRPGWNELFRIVDSEGKARKINNIINYVNGTHKEMIVHAGNRFFRISYDSTTKAYSYVDITTSGTYIPSKVVVANLKDQRSQAFFNKGRCYIIGCGDFLVYGTWDNGTTYELRRVANDIDTYVPTTTISIDDDSVTDDIRANLDDINLLTNKRKNQLLGFSEYNLTRDEKFIGTKTYYKKSANGAFSVYSGWTEGTEIPLKAYYEKRVSNQNGYTWTLDSENIDSNTELNIVLETIEDITYNNVHYNSAQVKYLIKNNGADKTKLYKISKSICIDKKEQNIIGFETVEVGVIQYNIGKIKLNCDTTPQIENRDNIYVEFECAVEGYLDRIANCNFGILFGVNGNTDRLFLSGNSNFPNIDFHSEMDDYTYFGDLNTASMGSDSVAVNGYARLSDSTLVIYKEENNQEASIFYRQGKYKEYYDNQGKLDHIRGVFPTSAGSIGEGLVSRYACANFGGDNIILSKNGIFGIVLANNVATTERYTRERSRSINEKLKLHKNLSEAVAIVYKNRYYLSVDDVCYIADARYKYASEDDLDNTFNYEWWYWENIPARVWANISNQLYFGSADGRVCIFDDTHIDRTYQLSDSGDLAIDSANNKITYNRSIDLGLTENDIIVFSTNGIYSLFLKNFTVKDNKIYLTEAEITNLYDGIAVYADNLGASGLAVNTQYTIYGVDKGLCCFELFNQSGNVVPIATNGFRLHKLISQQELYLTNVGDSSFQLKDYKTSGVITLSNYNASVPSNPLAKFTHKANVIAKWYTPVFDLGTNESGKTLLKMTISTEPRINGRLSFGYETKSANKLLSAKGINVFSFEQFSFENFSFDTGFASSYSVRAKENFNFIIFRFISNNEYDCAINNFTVLYKLNKSNKGVR